MRQQNQNEEEIKALLKEAFPPVDAGLRRDLWPAMLQRFNAPPAALPWYDLALIAGLAAVVVLFPKFVFLFAYHL